jgi:hypothetical protein
MSVEKLTGLFNGESHENFIDVAEADELVPATAGSVPRAVRCLELANIQVALAIESRNRTEETDYAMAALALKGIIGKTSLPLKPLASRHNQ